MKEYDEKHFVGIGRFKRRKCSVLRICMDILDFISSGYYFERKKKMDFRFISK